MSEVKAKKKLKVLVNDGAGYTSYIPLLQEKYDVELLLYSKCIGTEKPDLVLFTGGEDVSPRYYNEGVGKYTSCNELRDATEMGMFRLFHKYPKLGICRGSQFLTVANGGKLIQHVEGHAISGLHTIQAGEKVFQITSTHHQMLYPYKLEKDKYNIIAYSEFHLSNNYLNGKNENIKIPKDFVETEIVYYFEGKSLCIQGHPEAKHCPQETKDYCLKLVENFL